jgi:hypothetical protein
MLRTARTLDYFGSESSNRQGVAIDALAAGVMLVVRTERSSYRLVVVDGAQHLVRVHGGVFPEPTTLRLSGATAGGSAIKVGWILVGMRMEFSAGTRRITSSNVHSVRIEPAVPDESSCERVA